MSEGPGRDHLQVREGLLKGSTTPELILIPDMLCLKEFAHDEQVLTLHDPLCDALRDRLAHFVFITVSSSTVNETISCLDGGDDGGFGLPWLGGLKSPETCGSLGNQTTATGQTFRADAKNYRAAAWCSLS